MLRHVLKAQSSPRGETIDRIRMYEITSQIAFLGRRRRVYDRLVSTTSPRRSARMRSARCTA